MNAMESIGTSLATAMSRPLTVQTSYRSQNQVTQGPIERFSFNRLESTNPSGGPRVRNVMQNVTSVTSTLVPSQNVRQETPESPVRYRASNLALARPHGNRGSYQERSNLAWTQSSQQNMQGQLQAQFCGPHNQTASNVRHERNTDQQGYRFGDITRGIVARGRQLDGRDKNSGYKFGDFTRGLFR